MQKQSILTACLIFGVVFLPLSYSHASEGVLCISVFVCDEQTGEILPEHSDPTNPCYSEWEAQCASYAANMMQAQLAVCHARVDRIRDRAKSLRERNQRVRNRIRRLRQQLR